MRLLHTTKQEWENSSEEELSSVIFRKEVGGSIEIAVHRDGFFIFDFSSHNELSSTRVIYGKRDESGEWPDEFVKSYEIEEEKSYFRTTILNVFQACMNASIKQNELRASPLSELIHPIDLISMKDGGKYISNANILYSSYINSKLKLTRKSRKDNPEMFTRRDVISTEIIYNACSLLDQLLKSDIENILRLVQLHYQAGIFYTNHDFVNSLINNWVVCEYLLRMLCKENFSLIQKTIKEKVRKNQKTPPDLDSWQIIEGLEVIDKFKKICKDLNRIRKHRNDWLHHFKKVTDQIAIDSVTVTRNFIKIVTGVDIGFTLHRSLALSHRTFES